MLGTGPRKTFFSHPTILCTKFLIKYQNLQKVLWNKEIWYVVLFCHPHIKCIITLIINHVLVTVGITHDSVLPSQSSSAVFCAQKYFTIKTKRETDKIEDREATLYRYIFKWVFCKVHGCTYTVSIRSFLYNKIVLREKYTVFLLKYIINVLIRLKIYVPFKYQIF